jgi:DNA-directed RNA polymerase specialized sigma24 family protein
VWTEDERLTNREIEAVLPHYEGLIHSTTKRIREFVDDDPEDIAQIFRVKLVRALRAYDPRRSRLTRDAFVFGAIANQKKDILKRRRRAEDSLEAAVERDVSPDGWQARHGLLTHAEQVYGGVEDDDLVLPSTLTRIERQIIALLYVGRLQIEAAAELGLTKGEMERAIRSVRVKLADWRPSAEHAHVPSPPLPDRAAPARSPSPARRA